MSQVIFYLIVGHFIADQQSDFVAKHKSRLCSLPMIPWYYVMAGHCAGHAAVVAFVTGNPVLGVLELLAHFVIDCVKCENWISIHVDQFLHVACKFLWWYLCS